MTKKKAASQPQTEQTITDEHTGVERPLTPKEQFDQIGGPSNGQVRNPHMITKPALHVIAMQVENIKKVRFARIRPRGPVVTIAGANGSGKTTLLDAIEWGLRGTTNIPSQPISKGQKSGRIQIDLGDFKVERTFSRVENGKEPWLSKLNVYGRNKERFPTPQSLLDGLMAQVSFDPLEFIRMEPKAQFETLRKLAGLDLSAIDAEKAEAYQRRRDAGRDHDAAKQRLAALPTPPEDLPEVAIDTTAIATKYAEASAHNVNVSKSLQAKARLQEMNAEDLVQITRREQEVKRLQAEIEQLKNINAVGVKQVAEMVIPDEINIADIAVELNNAQRTNAGIQRRDAYKALETQVSTMGATWEELDISVKQKEKERAAAVAAAKMPLEQLAIGEGEVLFEGLPFEQISAAEQIRVSVALGMASNPTLRVMRIKDGSLLDDNSLNLIEAVATSQQYQIWIERVGAGGGKVCVTMEDGEASGEEAEAGE